MSPGITIDARWLGGSGIGTYTRHLLAGVCALRNGIKVQAITCREHEELVAKWCPRVTVVNASMYSLREQVAISWAAKGCDLLHVPHYNAPLLHKGPLLVSILDLVHITDPVYSGSVRSWAYARPVLNLIARKADHIVTISEYSKAQIVERLGVRASKVTVIYCGVDSRFCAVGRQAVLERVSSALGLHPPYILYVGNLKPHKNVSTLLRAFALLCKRKDFPYKLLIVGDDARWGRARRQECLELGIKDVTHFVPHVTEKLLPDVYATSHLLVMPSTIEGFGFPILEAMACGTPVICSNAASLPEVGGDAVLYFDPASPQDLAGAIERVLNSTQLQETLSAKGLDRAKRFTWEESTRKHIELYRDMLGLN